MARERYAECSIVSGTEGVEIHCSGYKGWWNSKPFKMITDFSWKDVTQVMAFKRDCWSVDLICLEFELNGKMVVEVNEEMEGWKGLAEAMTAHLPGALAFSDWWEKVVSPAFEPCPTHIYPPIKTSDQHP